MYVDSYERILYPCSLLKSGAIDLSTFRYRRFKFHLAHCHGCKHYCNHSAVTGHPQFSALDRVAAVVNPRLVVLTKRFRMFRSIFLFSLFFLSFFLFLFWTSMQSEGFKIRNFAHALTSHQITQQTGLLNSSQSCLIENSSNLATYYNLLPLYHSFPYKFKHIFQAWSI